jgi:Cation/multidrug efflux pump
VKFTDLFVKRPVLAIVVNLVILIAGLQAIRSLSVRQYPRSDIAVVSVSTVYVGASADLVRGFVTTPIERVIASADGIDYVESTSAQGLSTILVHLKINYDTTAALTQIQAKVAQVRNDLPPEAQIPVIDLETADTQFAAVYIGFSSADLDQNQITDYLTRVVQPKLSAISGVQRPTYSAIAPSPCACGSSPRRWRRAAFHPPTCTMPWQRTIIFRRSEPPRVPWFP